ncbi:MAG: response regulator transcription factor [Pseudomonadales bacterium]
MRVLVVEDETELRAQLKEALEKEGYVVDVAADGEEGLYYGKEFPVDLAVIDLGLPKIDGVELIRLLRAADCNYPILILTARDGWQEKVSALDAGADDYMVKPFYTEELVARLNALLRRSRGFSSPRLEFGALTLDTNAKLVLLGSEHITLTAYEYKVLEYLVLNAGKVISKSELVEHIYDEDSERDSNVLEVFVRRLRVKLDPDESLKPIETVRGHGYRFVLTAD